MRLCEMIIQIFFRIPVLVKHETTGIFIAAVKMVVDTACVLARRPYQRQKGVSTSSCSLLGLACKQATSDILSDIFVFPYSAAFW